MSIASESVGSLIERLFPQPTCFLRQLYFALIIDDEDGPLRQQAIELARSIGKDTDILTSLAINFGTVNFPSEIHQSIGMFQKREASIRKFCISAIKSHEQVSKASAHGNNLTIEFKNGTKTNIPIEYIAPPFTPFDMFALASTLLSKSGAYHHVESMSRSDALASESQRGLKRVLNVTNDDRRAWNTVANHWFALESLYSNLSNTPWHDPDGFGILDLWSDVLCAWAEPVYHQIDERNEPPFWWRSAYSLMAISDNAAVHSGFRLNELDGERLTERSVWEKLAEFFMQIFAKPPKSLEDTKDKYVSPDPKYIESISAANRSIVNILPKSRTAPMGCTLRSTSLNLASLPGRGVIRSGWFWARDDRDLTISEKQSFNMLLIPFPYVIHSTNFRATKLSDVEHARWGTFEVFVKQDEHEADVFVDFVRRLLKKAKKSVGVIHGVVLPEMAIRQETLRKLIKMFVDMEEQPIELLCTGLREHPINLDKDDKPFPANAAYMATFRSQLVRGKILNGVEHQIFHEKHHRWRITESQVLSYGLSPTLDPSRVWWEDLRVVNRRLPFFVMRRRWTVTSLICEDLARNDPARTAIESVGPNLVIALLMDGPQIPERWPARYATVLADDPGSSVLSMSSIGLVDKSNKLFKQKGNGCEVSRAFALWRDDAGSLTPIHLEGGHHAVAISLTEYPIRDFSLDGRQNNKDAVALRLTGLRQIRDDVLGDETPAWEPD